MDVIHVYSREQAIEDGVLIDVSQLAHEAGFLFPTAVTAAVWNRFVEVPPDVVGQDKDGRLWDILWMLGFHIMTNKPKEPETSFQLYVANDESGPKLVRLKSVLGPGDDAKPVITIMLPEED